jgi:hypothetical protein
LRAVCVNCCTESGALVRRLGPAYLGRPMAKGATREVGEGGTDVWLPAGA